MDDRALAETMGAAALQSAARLKWADAVRADRDRLATAART